MRAFGDIVLNELKLGPYGIRLEEVIHGSPGTFIENKDGTIDVHGHVDISHKELKHIPWQFRRVMGNFICNDNFLKTLQGCPENVIVVVIP